MGATATLAAFATHLTWEQIPTEIQEAAKWYILDATGCALAGSRSAHARAGLALARELGGGIPEATLVASGARTTAAEAAFANTLCARGDTFDDTHEQGIIHSGSALALTALAMAERQNRTGQEIVAAMIAGAEICIRVASAISPEHYEHGFHNTGTCTVFGTAAVAARMLGLDAEATQAALSLAGDQAASLRQYQVDGAIANSALHAAFAARAGVTAALLAQKGFPAPKEILEGQFGFCRVFARRYDPSILTGGLGSVWRLPETSIKPYPSCRYLHGAVDATERLIRDFRLTAASVAEVTVHTFTMARDECHRPLPTTLRDAQFSIEYGTARVLKDGAISLDDFAPERITDPEVADIQRRIRVQVDPELDRLYPERWPFRVEIHTTDGRRLEQRVDYPPGSPENPLTREQVLSKFRGLAATVLPPARVEELADAIFGLDGAMDARRFAALLHP